MNKGYWIARINIRDNDAFKEYASRAKLAVEKYGGKYVVRGGQFNLLEGEHNFERNVVIEFDSIEKAQECFNSNEYQMAKSYRNDKADFNAIVVEGY